MTATTTAVNHLAAKVFGACAVTAVLAAGGTAAFNGGLPDGAQEVAASVGGGIGLNIPRPDATIGAGINTTSVISEIVSIEGAGEIAVSLSAESGLSGYVTTAAGFEADVVVASDDQLVIEFFSSDERFAVQVRTVDGQIDARVASSVAAFVSAESEANVLQVGSESVAAIGFDGNREATVAGTLGVQLDLGGSSSGSDTCGGDDSSVSPSRHASVLGGDLRVENSTTGSVPDPARVLGKGVSTFDEAGDMPIPEPGPTPDLDPGLIPDLDPGSAPDAPGYGPGMGECLCETVNNAVGRGLYGLGN